MSKNIRPRGLTARNLGVEHFRRDHEAPDRKHAALEPRNQSVAVRVRRNEHVASVDITSVRRDAPTAGTTPIQRERARLAVQLGTGVERDLHETGVVPRRVEAARLLEHHTAGVLARTDLVDERVARDEASRLAEIINPFPLHVAQRRELRVVVREQEPASARVVAIDRVLAGHALHQIEGIEHRIDELTAERAVALGKLPRPVLELGDDHPAVAGARTDADRVGLDHHGMASTAGELGRRHDSAVATADDDHVGARGQRVRTARAASGRSTPSCHSGASRYPAANGAGGAGIVGIVGSRSVFQPVAGRGFRHPDGMELRNPLRKPTTRHARAMVKAAAAAPSVMLDDVDKALIEALQRDGRLPYTRLASEVGLSEAAVRQRVQRLIESGVTQIVAVTDPMTLGFRRMAMVGLRVEGDLRPVADAIAAIPEVDYVVIVSGSFDLLVEVVCEDDDHLLNLLNGTIRVVPGVLSTETFTYLRLSKQTYAWGTR